MMTSGGITVARTETRAPARPLIRYPKITALLTARAPGADCAIAVISRTSSSEIQCSSSQNFFRIIPMITKPPPKVKADIISISIGGNNFLLGNMAALLFEILVKGDDSRAKETVEDFYKDFDAIVKKIRSLNPDAVILMQTLYNPQTDYVGDAYQVAIDILNKAIVRYSKENKGEIVIVDVAAKLKDSANDFAEDGIHPSAQGNEKIAVAVLKKLAELGLGKKTTPVINEKGVDISVPSVFTYPLTLYGRALHLLAQVYGLFA